MNCSTFRTHWVNYTDLSPESADLPRQCLLPEKPVLSIQMLEDRYALENHLLDAGEITTEQQEQALVVEMLQQYCDRVARYSTASYSVVIRNIIHYINLHLKDDLTPSTLAAAST